MALRDSFIPSNHPGLQFPGHVTAPDRQNTIPSLEHKEAIQGVLDKRSGRQIVELQGLEISEIRRSLEELVAHARAQTKILNELAGTEIEPEI